MAFLKNISHHSITWKNYEKILFRFFFIFFLLLIIPLDFKFYKTVFSINWFQVNFYELFTLTHYLPQFSTPGYGPWITAAIIAAIGGSIWAYVEENVPNYDILNYWLRVILRYRLAIAIIAYGLIKLFPLQMPYPSLSNLHTNYGDFAPWKIYYHTIGITPWYESFLGAVEIFTGVLLFFRRTTTFGSGILLGFAGNVFAANISYNIGEQVYGSFLLLIAAYLFAYDVPRLYTLLIKRQKAIASKFQPLFTEKSIIQLRIALKSVFVLFILFLGLKTYGNYKKAPYKLPSTPGLRNSYGLYDVSRFTFNKDSLPYSKTDTNRWQNVVFEKWATLSIKTAKPIELDNSYGDDYQQDDINRNYESAGIGGRLYFSYVADTIQQTLSLKNKNPHRQQEGFELHYSWLNDSTLLLKGKDEKNNVVNAVLNRIHKKYMLFEGRRKPIKL